MARGPRLGCGLERRTGSAAALTLTPRNWLPPLQRVLADLNPDLIASSDGGSNQLLVRRPGRILEQRELTLTRRPERRRMLWPRLELPEAGTVCVANLHASAGLPAKASAEVIAAAAAVVEWSRSAPLVFGGDFNLRPARDPFPFVELVQPDGRRLRLSDHAPVTAACEVR